MSKIERWTVKNSSYLSVVSALFTAVNIITGNTGLVLLNGLVTGYWFFIYINKDLLLKDEKKK